jgi:aldose 1-epimerase
MKITIFPKLLVVFLLLGTFSCKEKTTKNEPDKNTVLSQPDTTRSGIAKADFERMVDEKPVSLYVLTNKNGMEATFTNFGQHLVSLLVPDRNGNMEDVVLGAATLEGYEKPSGKYFGSVIGRYGNRIANGQFTLDGTTYALAKNNGKNHLHGGLKGFESVVWDVDSLALNYIRFHRISPDMEEGYPGNLDVTVDYTLTDNNELKINYLATTDKKTPVNLTNHSFFNLKGAGNGTIDDHIVQINADSFNAVDEGLIPTGEPMPVENTPFDFRIPKTIGQEIGADFPQLKIGNGYDHNFILNSGPKNKDGLVFAAKVIEPKSGRVMEVYTSEPGVQVYTGNFLDGTTLGKKGKPYVFRGSICLETQHFPDSPNQVAFPSTILAPGQEYKSTTVYKFSTQR